MKPQTLARKQLDKRLTPLRSADLTPPPRGWLRAIRAALGMTTGQLARRINVVPSRILALEKAEASGTTTLKSLRQAAEAMGCTLVYALVPTHSLEAQVRDRAAALADEDLARVDHTMRLEAQALVEADLASERERLVARMLSGNLGRLWDRP